MSAPASAAKKSKKVLGPNEALAGGKAKKYTIDCSEPDEIFDLNSFVSTFCLSSLVSYTYFAFPPRSH
jgi:hypothetical protein